jgi:tripartite-type tricarboxylate transporter receptor subunit TctC
MKQGRTAFPLQIERRSGACGARLAIAMLVACHCHCVTLSIAAEQRGPANYPARPVRILDGFPPGGATNFLSRVVAERLTERLGQPIVVDNRPGAASNLAAAMAAKASPDGYTLFMGLSSTLAPAPSIYPHLSFNVATDFSYTGVLATGGYVLVVHPSLPVQSLPELIAYAERRPGQIRYGSGGIATPLHLAMELLQYRTGTKLVHVPFKGAGPLIVSMTGAEIEVGFSSTAGALPMVKAGRLRALAISSARRAKALPDIQTVAEAGFANFDITGHYGLMAPAGTPGNILKYLNAELGKIIETSETQARLLSAGLEAASGTPEQFHQIMRDEIAMWAQVIRAANIPPLE